MATILTKKSDTASAVPVAGDLTNSSGGAELAVNTADKRLFAKNSGGTVVELGTNPSTIDINAGTIDGTAIGASSASTGAFTTLSASSTVTLSGGTANGVLYLNGSKVATSGSALTFDGSNFGVAAGNINLGNAYFLNGRNTANTGYVPIVKVAAGDILEFGSGGYNAHFTGSLGIGTSSPSTWNTKLVVYNSQLTVTGGGYDGSFADSIYFGGNSEGTTYRNKISNSLSSTTTNQMMKFSIANGASTWVDVMTLNGAGNVGIGTSSPSSALEVYLADTTYVRARENLINKTVGYQIVANGGTPTAVFSSNTSTGEVRLGGIASNYYQTFYTNNSERMRIDASGNLGLGVTPSAWGSSYKSIQVGNGALSTYSNTSNTSLYANAYRNSSDTPIYVNSSYATQYQQAGGAHYWYTAPSGTAGNAITFTQAMTLTASAELSIDSGTGGGRLTFQPGATQNQILSTTTGFAAYNILRHQASQYQWLNASSTQMMTLDASGNLGIGVTSPATRLEVNGASEGEYFRAGGGTISARSLQFSSFTVSGLTGVGHQINVPNASGVLTFATGSTERARIDSSGNLLVGTTSSTDSSGAGFKVRPSASGTAVTVTQDTSAGFSTYHVYNLNATNNGYRFYVNIDGGISNFSGNNVNLSDVRTKKNIEIAGGYLEKICAIPVKLFNYKDEPESEQKTLGVIAQDVEAVAPELVNSTDGWQGNEPEDGVPLKTIYTTDMMFAMMKAIQEQQAIIESLKSRLDAAGL